MSHLFGCSRATSLYGDCTCASIEMREHTDALNRLSQETSSAAQAASIAHQELVEALAAKEQLATVRANLVAFFALLDIEEETDEGRVFRPNQLGSCRAVDGERMNRLLTELKAFATSS